MTGDEAPAGLKLCPACGTHAVVVVVEDIQPGWAIRCADVACVRGPIRDTQPEAEAAWNGLARLADGLRPEPPGEPEPAWAKALAAKLDVFLAAHSVSRPGRADAWLSTTQAAELLKPRTSTRGASSARLELGPRPTAPPGASSRRSTGSSGRRTSSSPTTRSSGRWAPTSGASGS